MPNLEKRQINGAKQQSTKVNSSLKKYFELANTGASAVKESFIATRAAAASSAEPYLVRAFNEWILDNQLTPYLLVDAHQPNLLIPKEYVQDGKIVFNITPGIVSTLSITNEVVEFDARFSGRLKHIYVPIRAVLAIYAKENGKGMVFEPEPASDGDAGTAGTPPGTDTPPPKKGKPTLKVIK